MIRKALSALVVLAGLLAIYHTGAVPLRCNRENKRLEDATIRTMSQRGAAGAVSARENVDAVLRSIRACPREPNFYMIAAANYRILRRHEEAASMYESTLRLERRPEIYFQLGMTRADMGMNVEAVESFTRACRFVPVLIEQVPGHLREDVRARLADGSLEIR